MYLRTKCGTTMWLSLLLIIKPFQQFITPLWIIRRFKSYQAILFDLSYFWFLISMRKLTLATNMILTFHGNKKLTVIRAIKQTIICKNNKTVLKLHIVILFHKFCNYFREHFILSRYISTPKLQKFIKTVC